MSSSSSGPRSNGTGQDQSQPAAAPPDPQVASRIRQKPQGRRLVQPAAPPPALTPEQRLLVLDTWQRSGLPRFSATPRILRSEVLPDNSQQD